MWASCASVRQKVKSHVKHWKFAPRIGHAATGLWLNFSLDKSSHSNATTFNGNWEILPGRQFSKKDESGAHKDFCWESKNFCKFGQNISPGCTRINSNLQQQRNKKKIFLASTSIPTVPWSRLSAARKTKSNYVSFIGSKAKQVGLAHLV